jgi:hypothetical protein
MEHNPQVVHLNDQEQALADAIFPGWAGLLDKDYETRIGMLEKMGQLAESLLRRGAIPAVRVAYFTDVDKNVGGRGKSRKQVFEGNGTKGTAILRHAHFMELLRYFIYGPDLPESTIRGFCKIIEDDAGTSGMVLSQITAFVRKEVRDRRLDRNRAAEEFFKLSHESGKAELAESIRRAAKSGKK